MFVADSSLWGHVMDRKTHVAITIVSWGGATSSVANSVIVSVVVVPFRSEVGDLVNQRMSKAAIKSIVAFIFHLSKLNV